MAEKAPERQLMSDEELQEAANLAPLQAEPVESRPVGQAYALMKKGVVVVDTTPIFRPRGYAYIIDGAPTWDTGHGNMKSNDESMARIQFAKKTADRDDVAVRSKHYLWIIGDLPFAILLR